MLVAPPEGRNARRFRWRYKLSSALLGLRSRRCGGRRGLASQRDKRADHGPAAHFRTSIIVLSELWRL